MSAKPSFREWLKQLDEYANKYMAGGYTGSYTEETGPECWRGYYDNDYSPLGAFMEDMSGADD